MDLSEKTILSLGLSAGVNVGTFGYSYDLGIGSSNKLPANTHEIVLSASFGKGWK